MEEVGHTQVAQGMQVAVAEDTPQRLDALQALAEGSDPLLREYRTQHLNALAEQADHTHVAPLPRALRRDVARKHS